MRRSSRASARRSWPARLAAIRSRSASSYGTGGGIDGIGPILAGRRTIESANGCSTRSSTARTRRGPRGWSPLTLARFAANAVYRYAPPFLATIARGLDVDIADIGVALAVTEASGLASPLVGQLVDRIPGARR